MSVGEQISLFDQDSWFGKTFPECSAQTTEKTSEPYSKKPQESSNPVPLFLDCRTDRLGLIPEPLWETDGLSLGGFTMHSFGESPNVAVECHLSEILEVNPHPKYCLSERACLGILNRARKRGKELPKLLEEVLIQQSHFKSGQAKTGGAKESSYNTTEPGHCQPSITKPSSTICIEGNGSRESHKGNGYRVSDKMFTLNTIEQHGVVQGVDCFNQAVTGDVTMALSSAASDPHHIPCCIAPKNEEPVLCDAFQHHGYRESETCGTLTAGQNNTVRGDTPLICEPVVCYSQDAYDQYNASDNTASLKQSGGNYGGGSETLVISGNDRNSL